MAKLNKLNVVSFARLQAVMMAIVGLIAGISYSFGGLIVDGLVSIGWVSSASASTPGLSLGTILAFGALIGMPIIFSIVGFVVGFIEGFLYNMFSKWFGGVELEFE